MLNVERVKGYFFRLRTVLDHPGNKGRGAQVLMNALKWRVHLLVSKEPYIVDVFERFKFNANNGDQARALIYYGNRFDHDEMNFIEQYLRPGDSFLDVGANVGLYSMFAATLIGPTGHIDAIEAVPRTARLLEENIRRNGLEQVVTIHRVAVGEREGTVTMDDSADGTNHISVGGSGVAVPCVRLGAIMQDKKYAFGKMDIEGQELPTFRGSTEKALSGNPPVWMIEVTAVLFRYGLTVESLVDWVHQAGYDVALYHHAQRTLTLTTKPWGNVFLIHRRAWPLVKERMPGLNVVSG